MTSRQINIPSTTPELTDIWPLESLLSLDIHKVIVMSKPKTMEGIELQIEQKPGHSATLWSEVCPGSESIFGMGIFNCNLWIPAKIKGRYEILFEFMLRGHRIDKTTTLYWRVLFHLPFYPCLKWKKGGGGWRGQKVPPSRRKLKKEKSMFERKYHILGKTIMWSTVWFMQPTIPIFL